MISLRLQVNYKQSFWASLKFKRMTFIHFVKSTRFKFNCKKTCPSHSNPKQPKTKTDVIDKMSTKDLMHQYNMTFDRLGSVSLIMHGLISSYQLLWRISALVFILNVHYACTDIISLRRRSILIRSDLPFMGMISFDIYSGHKLRCH